MAAACPLLLLELKVLVAFAPALVPPAPPALLVMELAPLFVLVVDTGQFAVQGMEAVNGRLLTWLADAKTGA